VNYDFYHKITPRTLDQILDSLKSSQ
jgi:hypothetical protein